MNVLEVSITAGILILIIIVVRLLFIHRLPKKTFLILWGIVLIKIFLPFSISSSLSIYSFLQPFFSNIVKNEEQIKPDKLEKNQEWIQNQDITSDGLSESELNFKNTTQTDMSSPISTKKNLQEHVTKKNHSIGIVGIWGLGVIGSSFYFLYSYIKHCRRFREAFPVKLELIDHWIKQHQLKRTITVKQTDRIAAPLTYGIIHPIILLPSKIRWEKEEEALFYILEHEYIHIKRFDAITKILLAAALCIHWFNPLVFVMYNLANRDIELACDEMVVYSLGEATKSSYALTLISMEEKKTGFMSICNNFSKNTAKERIIAIMKIKKRSFFSICAAAFLIVGVSIVFATSAEQKKGVPESNHVNQDDKKISESSHLNQEDKKILESNSLNQEDKEILESNSLNQKDEILTTSVLKNISTTSKEESAETILTKEEYSEIKSLQFEGYKDMTISEYRKKAMEFTDTIEHREKIEKISHNESLYNLRYQDEVANFFFNLYQPVTAENYEDRRFNHAVYIVKNGKSICSLEYQIIRTLYNPEKVTMQEHETALKGIMNGLEEFLQSKSLEQLTEETIYIEIEKECNRLSELFETDAIGFLIESKYQTELPNKEARDEFQKTIQPYLNVGLIYDEYTFDMYWNGKEVRVLYDSETNNYITLHLGTGFSEDAVDLYAVYKNGVLVGLREATKEEREQETKNRENEKETERKTEHATKEDYESILSTLYTKNYKNKSIAEFNQELLNWANENDRANEQIFEDIMTKQHTVELSKEQQSFLQSTVLSNMENAASLKSIYENETEEDIKLGFFNLKKEDTSGYKGYNLDYWIYYHISDKTKLTVEEREHIFSELQEEIKQFWNNMKLEEVERMSTESLTTQLNKIAKQFSTQEIRFKLDVAFEVTIDWDATIKN